eukprot:gnl/TRDRNA2_/TRDRNA2_182856_c0_seq1.p1 gnl/TRDRNA2_/TRDRNA2_182856_c0~~gnl/TRDRNA2_/TRDRNA2_182856_c0_seq1.p1  ORF type:complete len:345 (+),score=36.21 gnl/TRDRNA2_/TRDRNA2_182856_c0_seq1:96-1130(+)
MFGKHQMTTAGAQTTVVLMSALYGLMWYVYNILCHPLLGGIIFFNATWLLSYMSYLKCSFTDPGTPSSAEWQEWLGGLDTEAATAAAKLVDEDGNAARRTWAPGLTTFCKKCNMIRPERAHHCSVSDTCVLRMDHYCPWIGNCVGMRNQKFFLLMNFWSAWSCIAFLFTLDHPTTFGAFADFLSINHNSSAWTLFAIAIALIILLITGGMFCFSMHLAFSNCTSIEERYTSESPYAHPSSLDNLREVVGPIDWRLLLPLEHPDRPAGTSFVIFKKMPCSDNKPEEVAASCSQPALEKRSDGTPRSADIEKRSDGSGGTRPAPQSNPVAGVRTQLPVGSSEYGSV